MRKTRLQKLQEAAKKARPATPKRWGTKAEVSAFLRTTEEAHRQDRARMTAKIAELSARDLSAGANKQSTALARDA